MPPVRWRDTKGSHWASSPALCGSPLSSALSSQLKVLAMTWWSKRTKVKFKASNRRRVKERKYLRGTVFRTHNHLWETLGSATRDPWIAGKTPKARKTNQTHVYRQMTLCGQVSWDPKCGLLTPIRVKIVCI